ncbi:DUF302 domain-containing protein [Marisediminicola senii]|uniref:DUF302 domain-containing protein n=1 Tax=Marisediminicola senii TaxID=2711233 RepID=UPI0013ECF221|nr:DUF302 domain-containing protein [Marisediminicola senii]
MAAGLTTHDVDGSVGDALDRLRTAADEHDVRIFAVIDHAAAAREVGLELPDEVVAILGNPVAGTPLMRLDPRVGLDLPLRILLWDDQGVTKLAYRPPVDLAQAFDLGDAGPLLQKLTTVLAALANEVTS